MKKFLLVSTILSVLLMQFACIEIEEAIEASEEFLAPTPSPTPTSSPTPTPPSAADSTSGAFSGEFSCALMTNQTVRCWGLNTLGQLGRGTTSASEATPSSVLTAAATPLNEIVQVVIGFKHACALRDDNNDDIGDTVYCWGDNTVGQLGHVPADAKYASAVTLADLKTGATKISASASKKELSPIGLESKVPGNTTCALINDGTVQCWGEGSGGQIGDNNTTDASTPVTVLQSVGPSIAFDEVTDIAVGGHHVCAIYGASDNVACWGDNEFGWTAGPGYTYGLLGDGNETGVEALPVDVVGSDGMTPISGATKLAVAGLTSCALMSGGTAKCWGTLGWAYYSLDPAYLDDSNLLYTNKAEDLSEDPFGTPVQVTGITDIAVISTLTNWYGFSDLLLATVCVVKTTGAVQCLGSNSRAEAGASQGGGFSDYTRYARWSLTTPLASGYDAVYGGGYYFCAHNTTNNYSCWGDLDYSPDYLSGLGL